MESDTGKAADEISVTLYSYSQTDALPGVFRFFGRWKNGFGIKYYPCSIKFKKADNIKVIIING